jgi:hypothetical protein
MRINILKPGGLAKANKLEVYKTILNSTSDDYLDVGVEGTSCFKGGRQGLRAGAS